MKSIPENFRTVITDSTGAIGSAFIEHLRATGALVAPDGQLLSW
jgi:hypothetical protein